MEASISEAIATKEFAIKIAEQSDVIEAIYITKIVMNHLLKNNFVHPDLFTDSYEEFKAHANSKSLYILKKNNVSLGFLTFDENEPSEFKSVSWENCLRSFYISRIYVLPGWRKIGIGSALLRFAEELAKEKGFDCIRLDTSSNFEEGNILLMKHNYRFAGNIYFNFQKIPVNCYEKNI